jgi:hypothetical protein
MSVELGSVELELLPCFPCGADKKPAVAGGFKSAVTGHARIEELFRRFPGALVGAPTGAVSGFDVLDVDRGGEDWLAVYEATHGLPATRIQATRSGGLHVFFKHRAGLRCSAGLIAPDVDIRGDGGYIIWWPASGCRVLSGAEIAEWPEAMLGLLHEAMEARGRRAVNPTMRVAPVGNVCQGDRYVPRPLHCKINEVMKGASLINQRRARGMLRDLVEARENRNHQLYQAALQFRELVEPGIIAREAAEELLFMSAELCGYVAKRGAAPAWATIKSGLDARGYGYRSNTHNPSPEEDPTPWTM